MSHHRFSQHPIYRNAPWPNSYLIHPLSTRQVKLTCLAAYTNDSPLGNKRPTYPLDRFAWLKLSPAPNIGFWFGNILDFKLNKTVAAPSSKALRIALEKRLALTSCDRSDKKLRCRSRPIPTIRPAITSKKAHAKLAAVMNTMKQIQKTAQAEASNIVSDILENRATELTIKSVNNPMIIRHTPASIGMAKRIKPLVPEPAFSTR